MGKALQRPNGWEPTKIKDVALVNPRSNFVDDDSLVTFLPMNAVSESGIIQGAEIRKAFDVKKGFTSFVTGDVLVAKITPCFENYKGCLCTKLKNDRGYGSTEFHVLRPKKNITSEYLHILTRTHHFRGTGELNMTGTAGQKRVPAIFLKNYNLLLPPLPEQKAIADLLSTWDKAIEKTERLIQVKEQCFCWLLRKLMSPAAASNNSSDECLVMNDEAESNSELSTHHLSLEHVVSKPRKTQNDASYESTLDLPSFDIADSISKEWFLYYMIRPEYYRRQIGLAKGQRKARRVNPSEFLNSRILLPPLDRQKQIARALSSAQYEIDLLKQLAEKYKTQKRGLMQKMLTGEWRVKPEIVNQYMEA